MLSLLVFCQEENKVAKQMLKCKHRKHLMNPNHWVSERRDNIFLVYFTLRPQEESGAVITGAGITLHSTFSGRTVLGIFDYQPYITWHLCCVQYIHRLHCTKWRLTCTETAPSLALKKKKNCTYFLPFPWQQQTLHTRGARGLQLKQELSLGKMDPDSQSLPLVSCFMSFTFISLLCWSCHVSHTRAHTHIHAFVFLCVLYRHAYQTQG